MSLTFDPYKLRAADVSDAQDVIMTNPTATQELEAYWETLPRIHGVPMRKAVDPVAMGGLLEDSFILERVAPGVARIRVAGRNVAKLVGLEPRGLPLTAILRPESRAEMVTHIEATFCGPTIVELPLESPRAVGQPLLEGKIMFLPLRDDHGRVSRVLGVLVMSGRRGLGGRRFVISTASAPRLVPVRGLYAVKGIASSSAPSVEQQPVGPVAIAGLPNTQEAETHLSDTKKADDKPALRLVVSNP
ncbi:MAG: PAS domain-containing protein [Octadecabacter sp.]